MFNKNKKTLKDKKGKKNNFSLFLAMNLGNEREYFIENLSMLMNSGMNITSAIKSIRKEVRTKAAKKLIDKLLKKIEAGYSFSDALIETRIFSDYTVSLIKVGEESGRLKENLKVIAEQEQKNSIFKGKLKSAMMYPSLILVLSVTIGIGIAWFILPRLSNVFDQLDMELPLITQALIFAGIFLGEYGKIAIPAFAFLFFFFSYFIFFFSKTKFIGQSILFVLPGVKKLVMETELARFGYTLGTLLEAGLPVVPSLESLSEATPFRRYRRFFEYLVKEVDKGNSFNSCFKNYKKSNKVIPATIQQMIISGEKSGSLSEILIKIGKNYEMKLDNSTKNLTVLLEPIMLVIVWLGVVSVALAVILPIYSLIGGLNEPREVSNNSNPPSLEAEINDDNTEQLSEEAETENLEDEVIPKIRILETGLGYLNVREEASLKSEIVGEVVPGEEYENIGQREDWYQIIYEKETGEETKTGWVFGEYVEMVDAQ